MVDDSLLLKLRAALAGVTEPRSGRNIIAGGMVQGLSVSPAGVARFALENPDLPPEELEQLAGAAQRAAEGVEGVARAAVVATTHRAAASVASAHENPLGMRKNQRIQATADSLAGVNHVIAVASGKGGVGKSTIAANLAAALARKGLKVGFLDADIYGPSAPTLFGLSEKPPLRDGKIVPPEAHGVRVMSIGLIVDPQQALAWRGPMVMGAVRQLMNEVDWGTLDILIIDTPPGTGDVHLTLAQSKKLTGAVIVSTPQALALADVRRGVELFRKTSTPILGVIENMAWLETAGGERQYLFGKGGARRAAEELDAPFLGEVPLFQDLREASDAGAPIVTASPDSAAAQRLSALAEKLACLVIP